MVQFATHAMQLDAPIPKDISDEYYIELIKWNIKFKLTEEEYDECRALAKRCETKDWRDIDYDRRYLRVKFYYTYDGEMCQTTRMVASKGLRRIVELLKDITPVHDPRYSKLLNATYDMLPAQRGLRGFCGEKSSIDAGGLHALLSALHTRLLRLECNLSAPSE